MSDIATMPLACVRCGYDLRGSPADGVCPECGTAVAVSAADLPGWYLGRVAKGAAALAVAGGLSGPVFLLTAFLFEDGRGVAGCLAGLCFECLKAAGVFATTSRTPGHEAGTACGVTRGLAVVVAVGWVGALVTDLTPGPSDKSWAALRVGGMRADVLTELVLWHMSLYGTVAALASARRAARRLCRARLAEYAGDVAWAMAAAVPAAWVSWGLLANGTGLLAVAAVFVPVGVLALTIGWAAVVFGRLAYVARRARLGGSSAPV